MICIAIELFMKIIHLFIIKHIEHVHEKLSVLVLKMMCSNVDNYIFIVK